MVNVYLEIQRLKYTLTSKGIEEEHVEIIAQKAHNEIMLALKNKLYDALDTAVRLGVDNGSVDFINELRPREDAFLIETESGMVEFGNPPFPMLDKLLANGAKPMKDGSGVYKVIPVGEPSKKPKQSIHSNIFDAQKALFAERYESSVNQYNKIAPKGSKVNFRTVTSKQNRSTDWVLPEKKKDFTEDLQEINRSLERDHDEIVMSVIRSYEESY